MAKVSYSLALLSLTGIAGAAVASPGGGLTTVTLDISPPDPGSISLAPGAASVFLDPITLGGKTAPQFYFGQFYEANTAANIANGGESYIAIDFLSTAGFISGATDFGTDGNGNTIVNPYAGTAYNNSAIGNKLLLHPGLGSAHQSYGNTAKTLTGAFTSPALKTFSRGAPVTEDLSNINLLSYVFGREGKADFYSQVVFDPNGTVYRGFFQEATNGGLASVTYAAVPEPEAWALLLAGSAVAGVALRARRRKAAATA